MADLTRGQLDSWKEDARIQAARGGYIDRLSPEVFLALLSMASRCVSEETVRKLAAAEAAQRAYAAVDRLGGDTAPALRSLNKNFDDFTRGCHADLLEAAEALAKEGK